MSAGSSRAPGSAVEVALGHTFGDSGLLDEALTHPSYAHEHVGPSNERLEFLGDAVLGLVVGQLLYEAQPDWSEGQLSRARASLVNSAALAGRARRLGLGRHVKLGKTEQRGGGADKDSILGNLFEALLGAVYLDGGLGPAMQFVRRHLGDAIARGSAALERDPKTRLNEWAHSHSLETPRYASVGDSGVEDDERRFAVEVRIGEEAWGRGTGRSKRRAEMLAAEEALRNLAADE